MPWFNVGVREVHVQPYLVQAENAEAAVEEVFQGGGILIEEQMEYSHTLDSSLWDTRPATQEEIDSIGPEEDY